MLCNKGLIKLFDTQLLYSPNLNDQKTGRKSQNYATYNL